MRGFFVYKEEVLTTHISINGYPSRRSSLRGVPSENPATVRTASQEVVPPGGYEDLIEAVEVASEAARQALAVVARQQGLKRKGEQPTERVLTALLELALEALDGVAEATAQLLGLHLPGA